MKKKISEMVEVRSLVVAAVAVTATPLLCFPHYGGVQLHLQSNNYLYRYYTI